MKYLIFALLFISISALGQTTNYNCSQLWLKADYSGLPEASAHNNKTGALLKDKNLHDSIIAKACNTRAIYYDFAGNRDSAIVWYEKARTYLQKYPKLKVYTYLNEALAHEALTDYAKMFSLSEKALKLNKTYGTQVIEAVIYQTMSVAYFRTDKIDKATEYLLKGIAILEKQHDNCYIWLLKLNLTNAYIQTNNYKFATDLFEEYLRTNEQAKGTKKHTIAIVNYTECLIELNQYDKAYTLLSNAIPNVKQAGDTELEGVLYYRIANLEDKRGNIDASLANYDKAYVLLNREKSRFTTHIFSDYLEVLNKAKHYNDALTLASLHKGTLAYRKSTALERFGYETSVAEIYKKTGHYKEANDALTEAVRLSDSLRQINNGYSEQEVQARYQTQFQREKNLLLSKNNQTLAKKLNAEEQLIYMYILASIAAGVVIFLYVKGARLRAGLQKERIKNMEADKNLVAQQHVHEQELIASQKSIITEKQREATSIALQLADHYDKLNQLVEKFNTPGYATPAEIKKELLLLVKQKDYWKQFETRFNDLNPEFATTLIKTYPRLTKNDVEFCSLIKLKLTYKEIASLLQISHESVITKKYRIRKKMNLQDEVAFEQILAEI